MAYESIPSSPGPSLPGPDATAARAAGDVSVVAGQPTLMENDAATEAYAKDLHMMNSAVAAASVLGDLEMKDSAVVLADVTGAASLRDSGAGALVAEGPVDLVGGMAGVVVAREFTVRDGGTVLMTQREAAILGAVFAGVLLGGWMLLRALFGRR